LPLVVLSEPKQAKPVDWVLLCTKAHQTEAAAPWLQRLCTSATRVAVLQNGIDHVGRVAPLAGGATVVPVLVYYNAERLAPDRVRVRRAGDHDLVVADDEGGRLFAQLLDGTELRALLSGEFATLAWRKLLINAVANPITALTMQRQAVLRRPDVEELCRAILEEAVATARADGVRLADDEVVRTLATLRTFSPEFGTSMYFDRLAGRSLEVEALTGAIVAVAERRGVAAPLNRALLALLRAVNGAAA
jgi:2-dehydropantoate 2-reductase